MTAVVKSSFSISGDTALFWALSIGHLHDVGVLEEITIGVQWDGQADYTDLKDLVSPTVAVQDCGNTVYVDVWNGPGAGSLVIDHLGTYTAVLRRLTRSTYLPSGKGVGQATFLITATA